MLDIWGAPPPNPWATFPLLLRRCALKLPRYFSHRIFWVFFLFLHAGLKSHVRKKICPIGQNHIKSPGGTTLFLAWGFNPAQYIKVFVFTMNFFEIYEQTHHRKRSPSLFREEKFYSPNKGRWLKAGGVCYGKNKSPHHP